MKTINTISPDVNRACDVHQFEVHQGDKDSREYHIILTNNAQPVTLTGTMTASADAVINDVIVAQDEALTVDTTNQYIVLTLTEEMLSMAGILKVDVKLSESGAVLTAATLSFYVGRSVINSESRIEPGGTTIGAALLALDSRVTDVGEKVRNAEIAGYYGLGSDAVNDHIYNVHNADVATYFNKTPLSGDGYAGTNVTETLTVSRADRPNGVSLTKPTNAAKITLRDTVAGKEWKETVSGSIYVVNNLIPSHPYYYYFTNSSNSVLQVGVIVPSGQIRMIDGGGNTFNIRDLGGWTCDGGKLKYGLIYRGCRLNGPDVTLSSEQVECFRNVLDIRDEIDLRSDSDAGSIRDTALGVGVDYTRVTLHYYQDSISQDGGHYAKLIKRIAKNVTEGKVSYIHCSSGADRTAQLCMMIEAICGVSQSDLDRDYELTSFAYETNNNRLYSRRRNYDTSNTSSGTWKRMIAAIEALEGDQYTIQEKIIRYLIRNGVSVDEINAIRFGMIDGTPAKIEEQYAAASVTMNLTNVFIDNAGESVKRYQAFTAALRVNSGYKLQSVSVTMGGTDITSTCFADGKISIPCVTGNIAVTASATAFENLFATPGKVWDILDDALSGSDDGAPCLLLDNDDPSGHYILYYVDSGDERHELFDFSQYFAEKADTLAGYGIANGVKYVNVSETANSPADNCTEPFTVYNVQINSGLVSTAKMDLICVNSYQKKIQYAFSRSGNILFRGKGDSDANWSAWDYLPTKTEMDTALALKANVSTTLAGYGITNAYTKSEINAMLADKQDVVSWADVRNEVRRGHGANLYPVGYEFAVETADGGFVPFVVRGHDTILAKNNKLTHAMILESKYVYGHNGAAYSAVQFDAPEALCYVENGLTAGTYHFNWNDSNGLSVGDYQFTLASGIPPRGQITINTSAQTVTTYASVGATTAIESNVQLSQGTGGTDLGTTGSGNLNHALRVLRGSNNYAQSAARQLINSAEAAGDVWAPVSKFDRPPSWVNDYEGFALPLDPDFLAVVETAVVPCRTNNVFETASLDGTQFTTASTYTLYDKFFLLSPPEIYGDWDSTSIKDGVQLEYYTGLSNAERIHRDKNGSARSCFLRSPNPEYACSVRFLYTNGNLGGYYASGSIGVAPACIIA